MPNEVKHSNSATVFYRRMHYRLAASPFRKPLAWWRHRGLREQDVILGCYPRSGGTWLRFTLFEILTGQSADFDKVNSAFRGLTDHRHGWPLLPNGGRFIGSHEPFRSEYRKAVYLVRDARDVALSEFAFEKNLGIRSAGLDDYLDDMLLGRKRYGSWQDHVRSWIDSPIANSDRFLLIRYEDLRQRSAELFGQLSAFLGIPKNDAAIERALANNSIDKMREKEDSLYSQANYEAVPRRPERGVEPGGRFVRVGRMGSWQDKLTPEQLRRIEFYAGDMLRRLNYPMASGSAELS
jgi:hypothetical protein